jgi:hypothetical protein
LQAYDNIREKYLAWMKASDSSWRDYLVSIQKNSLTGEWAKEVAKHLFEEDQKCQIK